VTLSLRAVVGALVVEAAVFAAMAVVVADVRTHTRVEREHGVNARGFRGELTVHKVKTERRVAIVGGTAAYGYTVGWKESLGPVLESRLRQGWRTKHRAGIFPTVVNLAELGAGAASYSTTLRDYADLAADVVCIYDGYAPTAGDVHHGRDESMVFRRIRYLPILGEVVSGSAPWSTAPAGIDPFLDDTRGGGDPSCEHGSSAYCGAMAGVVQSVLSKGTPVVVVAPPYVSARHRQQQESLSGVLRARYAGDPRFSYVAIGSSADLHDPAMSADGVNLNTAGYEAVADRLVDVMFDAIHLQ